MRLLFALFFGFYFSIQSFAGLDSIPIHVLNEDNDDGTTLYLDDSWEFIENFQAEYSIEELLRSPQIKFSRPTPEQLPAPPSYIWSRIKLKNEGLKTRHQYFEFDGCYDSIWIYLVEENKVISEGFTGTCLKPFEKIIPTAFNDFPVTIDPNEIKFFYFKKYYASQLPGSDFSPADLIALNFIPAKELIIDTVKKIAIQTSYAGIMFLFSIVSLFMFGLFRERVFLYFTGLILSYIAYFWVIGWTYNLVFNTGNIDSEGYYALIAISGIVIFSFLFVSEYLNLRKRLPRFYWLFLLLSFLAAVPIQVIIFFNFDSNFIREINDVLLLVWIFSMIISAVFLSVKKEKTGYTLLTSFSILIVAAVFHIMFLLDWISNDEWTYHIFQFGTVFFSGILFYGLFEKINDIRNEKKRFEELDQLKSRFFANISHEFRTPLTLVMGPIGQVIKETKNPERKNLLQVAHQNAGRLLELINQLLDLSKLESGKMQMHVKEQNFARLLKGIVMSFESLAEGKNIRLNFIAQHDEILLFVDKNKIERVFYNLLSNALKFTPENGEVSVMITEKKARVEIMVKDTGIGIPEKQLPLIFDRFYQVDNSETREEDGTGIGLALVKELVELHGGSIHSESKEGAGATFRIWIPKGNTHLKEENLHLANNNLSLENSYDFEIPVPLSTNFNFATVTKTAHDLSLPGKNLESEKPTILIIEDHPDVRIYIKQHLIASCKILEAENGAQGIDTAIEQLPDLIISDVMMPKKNGYEVCQTLKNDPRTDHIPIILLTAKAAHEEKLEGLQIGADDYLIKPFDTVELETRIRNLIRIRVQLRQRFSNSNSFKQEAAKMKATDKIFIEKVIETVEANLSDDLFGVDDLAKAVSLSKQHLNRKMKALTDYSSNQFVRSYRLQRAMELLKNKTGNVSEISFETGFGSTAYFVKCFREKYGKTPGAVLEE